MEIFNDPRGYKNWYLTHEKIYESERQLVSNFEPYNCLDIGSGPSIFHEVFKGNTISLDISMHMLKYANENEDRIQADAFYLPFRDNSIDCVFISVTVCFLNDVEEFYKEVFRVAKGRVITCFIPRDSSWGSYYEDLGKKGHKYYSHAHFISRRELYDILRKYSTITKVKSTLFITPFEKEVIDKIEDNDEGSFICIESKKIITL